MLWSMLTTAVCVCAILVLVMAAWTDLRQRIIYNRVSLVILLLFPCYVLVNQFSGNSVFSLHQILSHLYCASIVFLSLYVLWLLNSIGGGDAKILSALSLWSGWQLLPSLLFLTAIAGGAIAISQYLITKFLPYYGSIVFEGKSFSGLAGASQRKINQLGAQWNHEVTRPDDSETPDANTLAGPETDPFKQCPYGVAIAIAGIWMIAGFITD